MPAAKKSPKEVNTIVEEETSMNILLENIRQKFRDIKNAAISDKTEDEKLYLCTLSLVKFLSAEEVLQKTGNTKITPSELLEYGNSLPYTVRSAMNFVARDKDIQENRDRGVSITKVGEGILKMELEEKYYQPVF